MQANTPRIFQAFAAFWAVAGLLVGGASTAQAMLDDTEKEELAKVFAEYNKTKTVGDLLTKLSGRADVETLAFLRDKTRNSRDQKLPKLSVHNASRVSFKTDAGKIKIDFISVRTQLLSINGHEVEFLTNDTPIERWTKISQALKGDFAFSRTPRLNPFWSIFEPSAHAKGKDLPADRLEAVTQNLNAIAMFTYWAVFEVNAVIHNCKSKAVSLNNNLDRIFERFFSADPLAAMDQAKQAAGAGGLAPQGAPKPKAKPVGPEKCSEADWNDLSAEDVNTLTTAGGKINQSQFKSGKEQVPLDDFNGQQINELSRGDMLNKTVRWKLQQIREALKALQNSPAEKDCAGEAKEKIAKFLRASRERTKSRSLRCYMDKIARDTEGGGSSAPVDSGADGVAAPDGKAGKGPGAGAGGKGGLGFGGGTGGAGGNGGNGGSVR